MKNDEIRWAVVEREDLLDVLLGEHYPQDLSRRRLPELDLRGAKLAVGYRGAQGPRKYAPPSLIVIPNDTATETLSWLRTFADETFPISQYSRVVLASEWRQFSATSDALDLGQQRPDRWASIAVGEVLSQLEGDTNLQNLALSRFAGCFTTPIARASLLWGHDDATRTCTDRLRLLESDRRFARRSVGVDELLPVWAIVGAHINEPLSPSDAVKHILKAAGDHLIVLNKQNASSVSSFLLRDISKLSSDSIEERVGVFNRLVSEIMQRNQLTKGTATSTIDGLLLAAAAFLVGRGTSHVFLLQRTQQFAPAAATWFGAMAALAGPRAWDKAWLVAAKGAERLLWPEFDWLEVSRADICWSEFEWIARTFEGLGVFQSLPKMLPRTLTIEIVPGASCQFRLLGQPNESVQRHAQETTSREQELRESLEQFLLLAQQVEGVIERTLQVSSGPDQRSLDLDVDTNTRRIQMKKKPKRKDSGGQSGRGGAT